MGSASSPAMSTSEMSGSPREGTPGVGLRRISSAAGDLCEAGGSSAGKGDQSLEASCRKCLEAAISSTTAFHAFSASSNRPIITNVFGTAHAYANPHEFYVCVIVTDIVTDNLATCLSLALHSVAQR